MSLAISAASLAPLVVCACGFVPASFADCDLTEPRSATVAADGAERTRVEVGAGSLRIEGDPDVSEVRVEGEACASSAEILERVRLTAVRDGPDILVRSELPEDGQARLDLVIRVPEGMALDVEDGSGDTEIRGTGGVRLRDGSGGVRIEKVDGGLELRDGSGDVTVLRVAGDVDLQDGSGPIDLRDVRGSVELRDGSGSIDVERVGGPVTIASDGSGSIRGHEVRGDVVVGSDGSGSIEITRVGGDFVVEEDGSGSIEYGEVNGAVVLPED